MVKCSGVESKCGHIDDTSGFPNYHKHVVLLQYYTENVVFAKPGPGHSRVRIFFASTSLDVIKEVHFGAA